MIKTVCSIVAALAWGLWVGGLFAVFVFVTALFAKDRELAVRAAPVIFTTFEKYQLVVGAVLLAALVGWRVAGGSSLVTAMFALTALAAAGAIVSPVAISGKMEVLRREGQSKSEEFRRLHGQSMIVYSAGAGALVATGILLPLALLRPRSPERKQGADSGDAHRAGQK